MDPCYQINIPTITPTSTPTRFQQYIQTQPELEQDHLDNIKWIESHENTCNLIINNKVVYAIDGSAKKQYWHLFMHCM